jgi:hypothetical protein
MEQMLNRQQLEQAAEQYAEACNSAWTNDYDGFIAGADFVLQKLQQCDVSLSLPPSESLEEIICSHCGVRDAIQTGKYCICCGAVLPQFGGNAS